MGKAVLIACLLGACSAPDPGKPAASAVDIELAQSRAAYDALRREHDELKARYAGLEKERDSVARYYESAVTGARDATVRAVQEETIRSASRDAQLERARVILDAVGDQARTCREAVAAASRFLILYVEKGWGGRDVASANATRDEWNRACFEAERKLNNTLESFKRAQSQR